MSRLWHWIRRGLLALVLLFVAYQLWLLGHVLWWKWVPPAETSFMSLRLDEISRDKPDAEQPQLVGHEEQHDGQQAAADPVPEPGHGRVSPGSWS